MCVGVILLIIVLYTISYFYFTGHKIVRREYQSGRFHSDYIYDLDILGISKENGQIVLLQRLRNKVIDGVLMFRSEAEWIECGLKFARDGESTDLYDNVVMVFEQDFVRSFFYQKIYSDGKFR